MAASLNKLTNVFGTSRVWGDIPIGVEEKIQTETPLVVTAASAMAAHISSHHQHWWNILYQSRQEVRTMVHVWIIVTDTWYALSCLSAHKSTNRLPRRPTTEGWVWDMLVTHKRKSGSGYPVDRTDELKSNLCPVDWVGWCCEFDQNWK